MSGGVFLAGQVTHHNRARRRASRIALHLFLTTLALIFMWPLLYAVYTSLRPYGEIVLSQTGPFSLPTHGLSSLSLDNYAAVWNSQNMPGFYWNTAVITIPAVILTLWVSSMVAFAISKFNWRFNIAVLMIFTAGNLLPPQVIVIPLVRLYNVIPLFPPIPMRAPVFVAVYGALELVLGVTGTQEGVAHFAHLGGLAGGYLFMRFGRMRP